MSYENGRGARLRDEAQRACDEIFDHNPREEARVVVVLIGEGTDMGLYSVGGRKVDRKGILRALKKTLAHLEGN
jgi:hypothetical protein